MKKMLLILLIASLVSGCTHISTLWRVDDINKQQDTKNLVNLDDVIARVAQDKVKRNAEVYALIKLSDEACEVHKSKIISNGSTTNFLASSSALSLSGLSAIATGVAARNLAAASAIVTGSTAEYNSNIYYGIIVPAIVREISKERTKRYLKIKGKLGNAYDQYPIQEALSEVLDYHYSCSFYNGLLLVTEDKATKSLSYEEVKARLADIENQIAATNTSLQAAAADQKSNLKNQLNSLETTKLILLNQLQAQASISVK